MYSRLRYSQRLTDDDSSVFDRMVTVRVGEGDEPKTEFQLYRGLLCHYSQHFDHLLSQNQSDAAPVVLDISVEVRTFQLFFKWLNCGSFTEDDTSSWEDLVVMYLFGETYLIDNLRNEALDGFLRRHHTMNEVPVAAADFIYSATAPHDPLRCLFVYVVAERWGFEELNDEELNLPWEFLRDVLTHLLVHQRAPGNLEIPRNDWMRTQCKSFCADYHVHSGSEDGSDTFVE